MIPKPMFILIATMLLISTPLLAAPAPTTSQASSNSKQPAQGTFFIFAYPGKTCPGGTELYQGPEQVLAADTNAVFCRFARKVLSLSKSRSSTYPQGMKSYADSRAKPGPDVIWCENDPDFKIPPPPKPPQPPQ